MTTTRGAVIGTAPQHVGPPNPQRKEPTMREPNEVVPAPTTEAEVLRFGLTEILLMPAGNHLTDPAYSARRAVSDYAQRILNAADAARKSVPATSP